jgi:hypothetical protein
LLSALCWSVGLLSNSRWFLQNNGECSWRFELVLEAGLSTTGVLTKVNSIKYVKNDPSKALLLQLKFWKNAYASNFRYKTQKWWCRRVKLPVDLAKNTSWTFKHNSTEEIESITWSRSCVCQIVMNQIMWQLKSTWKDVILDGYLGVFGTAKAPMKITFSERIAY